MMYQEPPFMSLADAFHARVGDVFWYNDAARRSPQPGVASTDLSAQGASSTNYGIPYLPVPIDPIGRKFQR